MNSLGSLNSFPSTGQFDEYSVFVNSFFFEHGNKTLSLIYHGLLVETEPGIYFNAHTTRYNLENFTTK